MQRPRTTEHPGSVATANNEGITKEAESEDPATTTTTTHATRATTEETATNTRTEESYESSDTHRGQIPQGYTKDVCGYESHQLTPKRQTTM